MNSTEIKRLVRSFRREQGLQEVSAASLSRVFERLGYTVIEFNPVVNDPDVQTLIDVLKLSGMTAHSRGFLWTDSNYRLVFLSEKLSEAEKTLVLAHELGHAACGHMGRPSVAGRDVAEEFEANEFAHFLLKKPFTARAAGWLGRNCRLLILLGTLLLLTAGGILLAGRMRSRALAEGEYYVTATGLKYHRKNCIAIEGHKVRRLTLRDVESGLYEPCSLCLP